jgi:hypothetical protein
MPSKQGTYGISDVYNQNYKIASIYKGNDLVYQKKSKNPVVQLIEKTIETVDETLLRDNVITEIRSNAFYNCSKLKKIKIPSVLKIIGSGAFSGCSSLINVELPASVSSIGSNAFENCAKLETINIPEGVTSINSYCFKNCSSLKNLTLPSSVTQLNDNSFYGCSSMKTLTLLSTSMVTLTTYSGNTGALSIISDETTTIYVPSSLVEQYKSNSRWSLYLTRAKNPITFVGI